MKNTAANLLLIFLSGIIFISNSSILKAQPTLLNPLNNSTNNELTITFSWSGQAGGVFYLLIIAKDANFTNQLVYQPMIADTFYTTGLLESNTKYYWQVRTYYHHQQISFSNVWNFTIKSFDFRNGLVSYYAFENSGNLGLDSMGQNNGTITGGVTSGQGAWGYAAKFDGSSGWITIPQSSSLLNMQNASFLYWTKYYKPNSGASNESTSLCNGPDMVSNSEVGMFNYSGDSRIVHYLGYWGYANNTGVSIPYDAKIPLANQVYVHGAFTIDNNSLKSYKNSCIVQIAERKNNPISRQHQNWYMGAVPVIPGYYYYLNGYMDEVRIYNRALPDDEIREIYRLYGGGVMYPSVSYLYDESDQCGNYIDLNFKISNIGTGNIKLINISLKKNTDFAIESVSDYELLPSEITFIRLSFKNKLKGTYRDTVLITSQDGCPAFIPITYINHYEVYRIPGLNSNIIDFGTFCHVVNLDTVINIRNNSDYPLKINYNPVSSPFFIDNKENPLIIDANSQNSLKIHFSPLDTGSFFQEITITDSCGNKKTITLIGKISKREMTKIIPENNPYHCSGDTVTLVAATDIYDVKWFEGSDTNAIQSGNSELRVNKPGKYYIMAKNKDGCDVMSNTVEINYYQPFSSGGDTVDFGEVCSPVKYEKEFKIDNPNIIGMKISVSKPDDPFEIKDYINDLYLDKLQTQTFTVTFAPKSEGIFAQIIEITDSCGNKKEIVLKGVYKPISPAKISADLTNILCEGDSLILGSSGNYDNYEWYNAETGEHAGNGKQFSTKTSGKYYVKVFQKPDCFAYSDTVQVSFMNNDQLEIDRDTLDFGIFCSNGFKDSSFVITNKTAFIQYIDLSGIRSPFSLRDDISPVSLESGSDKIITVRFTPSTQGIYYQEVKITDTCGNVKTIVLKGIFKEPEKIEIFPKGNKYICEGDSVLLYTNGEFTDYGWFEQSMSACMKRDADSIDIVREGIYYLRAKDKNGCDIMSNFIEVKEFKSVISGLNGDTLDFGIFCEAVRKDSVLVISNPMDTLLTVKLSSVGQPFEIAEAGSLILIKPGEDKALLITFNGSQPGIYIYDLLLTDTCGNIKTIVLKGKIIEPQKAEIKRTTGTVICDGDPVVLIAQPDLENHTWFDAESNTEIQRGGDSLKVTTDGKYYLKGTGLNGCDYVSNIIEIKMSNSGAGIDFNYSGSFFDFDSTYYPDANCKNIQINNKNDIEYTLNNLTFLKNTSFSVPQSQLPLIIPPKGSAKLTICYSPRILGMESDTLLINDTCFTRRILCNGRGTGRIYGIDSRCGAPVKLVTVDLTGNKEYSISPPYPNPANNNFIINFESSGSSSEVPAIQSELLNMLGKIMDKQAPKISLVNTSEKKYYFTGSFEFDISGFSNGLYFIRITAGEKYHIFTVAVGK